MNKHGRLVIVRHGESTWNAAGKWTGLTDVPLTGKGWDEARQLGRLLSDIKFDHAFISEQLRTHETLQAIKATSGQARLEYTISPGLNERDYGEYTGMNKWQMKEKLGEVEFHHIRRDWNWPVPGGETLKQVYNRSLPFYRNQVLPRLISGQTILIVAHGNSIRSLVKYIESISDEDISDVEMIFGSALIYEIDEHGKMTDRLTRTIDIEAPPA